MKSNFRSLFLPGTGLVLAAALLGCAKQDQLPVPAAPAALAADAVGAAGIAGLNWADPRDNFVDGPLVLSALTASESYATAQAKTDPIIAGFLANTGANTVRLPINPSTVLGTSWDGYTGVIDKTLNKGMKVILGCWEGNSSRDGRVDDAPQFWSMWQTVVNRYGSNPNVYFEVFNEPHGYSQTDLGNLYADWLSRYTSVPQGRVLLDGTGYAEDIRGLGADGRFNACLLAIHMYDFFYANNQPTTAAGWEDVFAAKVGSYASRAVLTEYGQLMSTGTNYNSAIENDMQKAFLLGITNVCRRAGISSVYWPGLYTGADALLQYNGTTMSVTNASGLGRVQYAWGVGAGGTDTFYPTAYYRVINRHSQQVLDVPGSSTASGAFITQYPANGGANQQWQILGTGNGYFRLLNRNSGQAVDVPGYSKASGEPLVQYPFNGGTNQQWQLPANGSGYFNILNGNSQQAIDLPGYSTLAGERLTQYPFTGGENQQWLILQQ